MQINKIMKFIYKLIADWFNSTNQLFYTIKNRRHWWATNYNFNQ